MRYSVGFLAVLAAVCVFPARAAKARAQEQAQKSTSSKSKKSNSNKGQQPSPVATPSPTPCPTPTEAAGGPGLDAVLLQMDAAAPAFHAAEANVTQEDYQKVVEDLSIEEGKIYFRRTSKGLQMAMDFTGSPESKYVLLADNKIRLYQPKIDQVTEHSLEKNSPETESMFALGFGGRGHDLLKSFDVKLGGFEVIDGIKTSKLELTPKTAGLKKYFSRIELWIELPQDISLRQQFWQPSGDYHLTCFSNIKINQSLPDDVFRLKTTSHTKKVRP